MLPDVNSSGVILQGAVIVTFDQEIDVTTYSESSFLLSCPPEAPAIAPSGLVTPASGTDYVAGTFSFALNSSGNTIATFKPARPIRPNVKYTVLISTDVSTVAAGALANNYSWTFVTGVLNLTILPIQQPGPVPGRPHPEGRSHRLAAVNAEQRPAPNRHRLPEREIDPATSPHLTR